ncbi:hypothetical protein ABPG72_004678 [Tetrahymena utriculariae]
MSTMEQLQILVNGYCKRNRDISVDGEDMDRNDVRKIIQDIFRDCQNQVEIFYQNLKKYQNIYDNFIKWIQNQNKKQKLSEDVDRSRQFYQQQQTEGQNSYEENPLNQRYISLDQLIQRKTCPDNFYLQQQSDLDQKINELKNQIKEEQDKIQSICEQMKYLPQKYELKFGMLLESSENYFDTIFNFMDQKNKQLEQLSQSQSDL